MIKRTLFLILIVFSFTKSKAQLMEPFVHEGEYGFSVGVGHYFGDLTAGMKYYNTRPKIAAGIFFKKQFNNYIGLKVGGNYAMVGYSDANTPFSENQVQKKRNLSFNSSIWEFSVSGEFNFFRFQPGFPEYRFTPYVSLGVGVFTYDPYTYLGGEKYFLRPLGTEGQQNSLLYPNLKPYSTMAVSFPIGFGLKYSLSEKVNIFGETVFRFTNTDHLDDVSGNYAPDAFPLDANGAPSTGFLLQDRSYEWGVISGVKGRQRGNSTQNDSYITIQVGLSFNLSSYKCPPNR